MDMPTVHLHGMAVNGAHSRAKLFQDVQAESHIRNLRNIFDPADPVYQQGCGNNGDSSIFGAADFYLAKQGLSALNNILCQNLEPLFKTIR